MATLETWALDGVSLSSGNFTLLELNVDPPKARPDWLTAADSEGAALARQPLHENRTITMKLRVAQQASMNAALDQIGVIRDKLYTASETPNGLTLVWTPANSTRTVTFDVLHGEIPELPVGLDGQAYSWFQQRPVITLEMTARPYWYGSEVTTSTATSATPFVTLEVPSVPGDVAALGRLIVTDNATQLRRHVEWGLENVYYNSGLSLLVDSDSMVTSGYSGTATTRTGAYDPNATGNNVIRTTLFGSSLVAMCNTGVLAHIGAYRVKARVYATADSRVRLAWRTGDASYVNNPWDAPPVFNAWSEVDLGVIQIGPVTTGTQRWDGIVQAYSPNAVSGTVDVDYLTLVPAGEGYGKAYVPPRVYQPGALAAFDDFDNMTPAANLNTRTPSLGAAWVTAGMATDFTGQATLPSTGSPTVVRATGPTDTSPRVGVLGSAMTEQEVSARIWWFNYGFGNSRSGVVARYVDINNYLTAYVTTVSVAGALVAQLVMSKVIAGVSTVLASKEMTSLPGSNQFLVVSLIAHADGTASAALTGRDGAPVYLTVAATDTTIATAGTIASGKAGIYDMQPAAAGATWFRYYDNVGVFTPATEQPVVYAGRKLEVRSAETVRQDSAGTYYGTTPAYRGSRFLVPPGTSRVLVKARRLSVEYAADDPVTDSTTIQVAYTPRGLVVPR